MKSNIALICQLPQYNKCITKLLSDKLEMFFVDVEEMIDFELGDVEHIIDNSRNYQIGAISEKLA